MISEETVAHVAKLARLELTSEETARFTQELGKILHLVDELAELDLSQANVPFESDYPGLFREDTPRKVFERDALLKSAPQEEDGFFRVPQILEEGS